MINFLFGLLLGLVVGSIGGLYFYAKKVLPKKERETLGRDVINSIIKGEDPKGEFIKMNPVTEYIKNHDGEIKLADVIDLE